MDTRRLARLAEVPLFARCARSELAAIVACFTELHVAAGQTLMREGTVGREVVVIAEGTASVWRHGVPIAMLGPSDVVGEVAVLAHGPRTATVTADTDLVVHVASRAEFADALSGSPSIVRSLLTVLARRITVGAAAEAAGSGADPRDHPSPAITPGN